MTSDMNSNVSDLIYFDNAATTKIDDDVIAEMSLVLKEHFGNPNSVHLYGADASDIYARSKKDVADFFNCSVEEVVFTGSGCEGDNLAVFGAAYGKFKGNHFITTTIEHKGVLNAFHQLQRDNFHVTFVKPNQHGVVSAKDIINAITEDTRLVSVMHVNNETGAVQPIEEIAKACRERGVLFHTDAVQSAGKFDLDVQKLGADMVTISAHKFHGPKGIAAVYVREDLVKKLSTMVHGGAQEFGLRGGTSPLHQIAGMALACKNASKDREKNFSNAQKVCKHFESKLVAEVPEVLVNGDNNRCGTITSLTFKHIDAEALYTMTYQICCSSGSACTEGSDELSSVLRTMGIDPVDIRGTLRYSFGKNNTIEEADRAVDLIKMAVERLRSYSPLAAKK